MEPQDITIGRFIHYLVIAGFGVCFIFGALIGVAMERNAHKTICEHAKAKVDAPRQTR